jgi:upstream activation factor subunit UAF30
MAKSKSSPAKKETTTQKSSPTTEEASSPAPPVQETTATPANPSPGEVVESLNDDFKHVLTSLSIIQSAVKHLTTEVRKLDKRATKELRDASKKNKKKAAKDTSKPKRPPSGFAKPSRISDELCEFLGKDSGTEMARTEVTKYITQYIKKHELQNPENKRQIIPDNSLKKLLNSTDADTVTYFNLQKYMKHHFPKKETQPAPAVASSS